ncbi:hypothetical protein [Streptomyces naphthomycinicus]|uniref:hypothetical protein n=1 Tax=Streptomyces naphthomycinicus TaxID=2872625 RepID=UPI001CEDC9A3|nr:hypothetical protein [Streptomyces sp. TML10]
MFTSQRIATVSGLVGSLAAICLGAGHAYAEAGPADCRTTAQGDVVCIRKTETRLDKDGTHVLKQEQDCSAVDRPRGLVPDDRLTDGGSVSVGPVVDCSNTAELPKGFKKPHIRY